MNSGQDCEAMSRMEATRKIRPATKNRIAASAASGVWRRKPSPKTAARITALAAARPATCDLPPLSATIELRGGLALTGKAPNRPASRLADAEAKEVAVDVRRLAGQAGKRARGRGALHHHHQGDDHGQSQDLEEIIGVADQGPRDGQGDLEVADNRQALQFQPQRQARRWSRRRARSARPAGAARNARSATMVGERGQRRGPAPPGLNRADMVADLPETVEGRPRAAGQAEEGRRLRKRDMHGDAGKKAGQHGYGEEIGHPAGAEKSGAHQKHADHQRQQGGQARA